MKKSFIERTTIVLVLSIFLLSMLTFNSSNTKADEDFGTRGTDFVVTTTADFDAGTKTDVVSSTDIANMDSGQIEIDADDSDEVIISVKEVTESSWAVGSATDDYRVVGNQFRPNRTWLLSKVALWIVSKVGSPGSSYIRIYELVNDIPSNDTVIASSVIELETNLTASTWHNYSFDPLVELEYNRKYAFVGELVTDPGGDNRWQIGRRNSKVHARGNFVYWYESNDEWLELEGYSTMFQLSVQERESYGTYETTTQIIPDNENLESLDIVYKGLRAEQNITQVELKSGGVVVATYDADITDIWDWTDYKYSGNPNLPRSNNNLYFDRDASAWIKIIRFASNDWVAYLSGERLGVWRIGRATSTDGVHWTPYYSPYTTYGEVLEVSTDGWDDLDVWLGQAWKEGSDWYMLYTGQNATTLAFQVGLANSTDGINWTKNASNPVFNDANWATDETEFSQVEKVGSTYYMYYNSAKEADSPREIGIATSTDLVNWNAITSEPIWSSGDNGTYFQNQFCPGIFNYGDYWYAIVAGYDEEFDYAELRLWRATSPTFSDKAEVKPVIRVGEAGTWEYLDMDTPNIVFNGTQSMNIYYSANDGTYWQSGMVEVPYASVDDALSGETTFTINEANIDSGSMSDVVGSITVFLNLSTASHLSPIITELSGNYGELPVLNNPITIFGIGADFSYLGYANVLTFKSKIQPQRDFTTTWYYGDGTISNEDEEHLYEDSLLPKQYEVRLQVCDGHSCVNETKMLTVIGWSGILLWSSVTFISMFLIILFAVRSHKKKPKYEHWWYGA